MISDMTFGRDIMQSIVSFQTPLPKLISLALAMLFKHELLYWTDAFVVEKVEQDHGSWQLS